MKGISNYIYEMGIFDIDANIESNKPMEEEFEEWCDEQELKILRKLKNGTYNLENTLSYGKVSIAPPYPLINKLITTGKDSLIINWSEDEFKKFMPKELEGDIAISCADAKNLDWISPDLKIKGNFTIYGCNLLERVSNDFGIIEPNRRGKAEFRIEHCPKLKSIEGLRVVVKNAYITFHKCPELRNLKWKQLVADWINFDYCGFDGLDNICNYGPCTGKLSVYE